MWNNVGYMHVINKIELICSDYKWIEISSRKTYLSIAKMAMIPKRQSCWMLSGKCDIWKDSLEIWEIKVAWQDKGSSEGDVIYQNAGSFCYQKIVQNNE